MFIDLLTVGYDFFDDTCAVSDGEDCVFVAPAPAGPVVAVPAAPDPARA